jgi:hypothetical protein
VNISELTTVIIPTSPSPKHPSTQLLEDAIDSIRQHIPGVQVIVQMDGVRAENENRRVAYEEYKRRVHDLCKQKYENVTAKEFPEYRHQAEMMRETFPFVKTPLLFYLEWDWIILPEPIDWEAMSCAIMAGELNHIRLCRWDEIHPEHEHLMCGRTEFSGCPVVKTIQWSGHPALISTEFFKGIISQFRPGCRTLIEEFIYGPVATSPWETYRCSVYNPQGSMRRIFHTDGREADEKFPAIF